MILSIIQALASTSMISIFLVEYMNIVTFGASDLAWPFFIPGVFLFIIYNYVYIYIYIHDNQV